MFHSPTKQDIADSITERLSLPRAHFSTGSTEPREFLDQVAETFGLGDTSSLTKPQVARHIVESAGIAWDSSCESTGGTVTREGLLRVRQAVEFFM
jgi:hypothetical protein